MHRITISRSLTGLVASVTIASCAVADQGFDEVSTGTEADAINGGTGTFLRPEVVEFLPGSGGLCTAVLISPLYFLTASHCINYTTTNGGSILMDHQSQPRASFPVNTVIPFGASDQGQHRLFDVALGRLQSPIAADVATPAMIADHTFGGGELLTDFGYGCDNGAPAGTKRFIENTDGNFNSLCSGDSGGPLFRGHVGDLGAIVGINSTAGSGDRFAHPVQYKKRIPSMMRAMDLGLEAGIDRLGSDYESFSTVGSGGLDAWVCAAACESDSRCKAFSYDNNRQLCFKKDAIPPIRPKANIFSGLPRSINGIDRPGADYAVFSTATADACQSSCARDGNCQSFTFLNGTCFLKNAVPAASTSCTACVSGNRRALENNYDRPGADFASTTTATPAACAAVCAKDWRCFSFTWNKINHVCHEKNEIPAPVGNPDGISAMRDGLEVFSFRAAGSSSDPTINLSTDLPEECQAACAQSSACLSWSFTPPVPNLAGGSIDNLPSQPAKCRLNSVVGAVTAKPGTGFVSGIKGMEFF